MKTYICVLDSCLYSQLLYQPIGSSTSKLVGEFLAQISVLFGASAVCRPPFLAVTMTRAVSFICFQ